MNIWLRKLVCLAVLLGGAGAPAGCASDNQVTGEIVGIRVKVLTEEILRGGGTELTGMAYAGEVVIQLSDGERVYAACSKEFLVSVRGTPTFTQGPSEEMNALLRSNASAEVAIDEKQQALLVRNESGGWVVGEILEQGTYLPIP